MNYNDYLQIMSERNLITTPIAEQDLCNARRVHENIKNIKNMSMARREIYPVDPVTLIPEMEVIKAQYINFAIKNSVPIAEIEAIGMKPLWWSRKCQKIAKDLWPDVASFGTN